MKRVSIVIPCLDPTDELLSLTESLTDYGFNDIIIINDGSSSECAAIFSALAEKPEYIQYYFNTTKLNMQHKLKI